MAKKRKAHSLQKQGLITGLSLALAVSILSYVIKPLHDIFYRDATAHLFPISGGIWSVTASIFGNIMIPNTISAIIVQMLIFVPFALCGWLAGYFVEKKQKTAAGALIVTTLVLWIYLFYLLSRPMSHGMH